VHHVGILYDHDHTVLEFVLTEFCDQNMERRKRLGGGESVVSIQHARMHVFAIWVFCFSYTFARPTE